MDKARLVSPRPENLAGRQRVLEPGSTTKSRGSQSSSAPHLSGRHGIKGFVYTGPCTAGNLGENGDRGAVDVTCMMNNCPIMLLLAGVCVTLKWRNLQRFFSDCFLCIFGAEPSL